MRISGSKLPQSWRWTRLGLLSLLVRRGISPSYASEGLPVVSQKCVRYEGQFDPSPARFHDLSQKHVSPDLILRAGDCLINSTGDGTLGRSATVRVLDAPITYDSHVTLVRPRQDLLDSFFLGYFLLTKESWFIDQSRGSTKQIELSQETVNNLPVPLPPIDQQGKIADYLDRETDQIDHMVGRLDTLVGELRARRVAVIDHAVWDSAPPKAAIGLDTALITSGSRGWSTYYSENGVRFLRITDLSRTSLDVLDHSPQHVDLPGNIEGARTRTKTGDLLLSITADIGSIALIGPHHADSYTSQHVGLVRLSGKMWMPRFAAYAIKSQPVLGYLKENALGGTKVGLNLEQIARIHLPAIPFEEQLRIADRLDAETTKIDTMIEKATLLRDELAARRSALITDVVAGRKPVN